MAQYAKALPVDQQNNPYTAATPNFPAIQSWSGAPTASSTIGLTDRTTAIQIVAIGGVGLLKWGASSVTASSFDAIISPGAPTMFVVPQSVMAAGNSVMGANGANGLYNKVSIFTQTASASVFGAEF